MFRHYRKRSTSPRRSGSRSRSRSADKRSKKDDRDRSRRERSRSRDRRRSRSRSRDRKRARWGWMNDIWIFHSPDHPSIPPSFYKCIQLLNKFSSTQYCQKYLCQIAIDKLNHTHFQTGNSHKDVLFIFLRRCRTWLPTFLLTFIHLFVYFVETVHINQHNAPDLT